MASAEEVQALKREVEVLKQMLEQERGRGKNEYSARSPGASLSSSPNRTQQHDSPYASSSSKPPSNDEHRREPSPRRPMTAATSPSRSKTLHWKDTSPTHQEQQHQRPPPHQHQSRHTAYSSSSYTQFVPVDSKRGKWWLKDRQILSRNVPSPNYQTVAMKVRETWLWSGRTVVIDKIVTGPRPRDDDDDGDNYGERDGDRRVHDLQDEATRYRKELRRMGGSKRSITTPTSAPLSAPPIAAQAAFHDSKQLAKEFLQSKSTTSSVVEELSEPMRTASQRMEAEMAKAVAAAGSNDAISTESKELEVAATDGGASESPSHPQTPPSNSVGEEGHVAPL